MNHFAFCMHGDSVSPIGGDTKSWFYYYKVDADETWVGIPDKVGGFPLAPEPSAGDRIWFIMDGCVLYTCLLIEAVHEEMYARWELHYNSNELQPINRVVLPFCWATGPIVDRGQVLWLAAIAEAPPSTDVPKPTASRPAYPEELATLGIVQRGQGEFILVPVKYNGQERYALAAKRNISGEDKVQVLALCLNLEQDSDVVASLDGTIASPLRLVRP
jgi:hypothetical protein